MADFKMVTMTNTFKVNNKSKLFNFLGKLHGEDIYTDAYTDKEGNIFGWFGAYSDIMYIKDPDISDEELDNIEYENCFEDMVKAVQELLTEDSYCAIKSIGNEKLRYIMGDIVYITKNNVDIYSLNGIETALTKNYFGEKEVEEIEDKEQTDENK